MEIFDEKGNSIGITGNRGPEEDFTGVEYQGAEEVHVDIINMMYDGMEKSIRDIDDSTWEGKLLVIAVAWLTKDPPNDTIHPDEMLRRLDKTATEIYAKR